MSGVSLNLYGRLAQSSTSHVWPGYDLSALLRGYWHTNVDKGGYWQAGGKLSGEDLTSAELEQFYNTGIGWRMVETSPMVSWEGQVSDMRLYQDGSVYQMTLDLDHFHNRVKVKYFDDINTPAIVDYSENTDSSAIFGEANKIVPFGGATSAGATAEQARKLAEFAWPRSRKVGGDAREVPYGKSLPDELEIIFGGYWGTLDWRIQETNIAAGNADAVITTLVGNSQFVNAGRIESNAVSRRLDVQPVYMGLGDAILKIIGQGDASGNMWTCGVYESQKLVYEQAPTTAKYILQGEQLLNQAGQPVNLAGVKAGFFSRNPNAPTGWARPGTSNIWDDPEVAYVERVTYRRGEKPGVYDTLEMRYQGMPQGAAIFARQIYEGSYGQ